MLKKKHQNAISDNLGFLHECSRANELPFSHPRQIKLSKTLSGSYKNSPSISIHNQGIREIIGHRYAPNDHFVLALLPLSVSFQHKNKQGSRLYYPIYLKRTRKKMTEIVPGSNVKFCVI
jgi:hypothetical protein